MHVIHVKFTVDVNLCIVLAWNINSFMLNTFNKQRKREEKKLHKKQ